jgi:sodium-dependent dicarboxylate transporter 2/3/5
MAASNGKRKLTSISSWRIGYLLAPALCLATLFVGPPEGLSSEAWAAAAVGVLMALWWMTEALPLAATALLPLVLFPLLKVSSIEVAAQSYAHPLIFLFLGGFLLAKAMERWQLHRRLALLATRAGGRGPKSLLLSVMASTAFLSMWVSNTATAMIMIPIGQSLIASMRERAGAPQQAAVDAFGASLMLGIAFAATIGGMGTLIGTPPNALFASLMQTTYGTTVGFAQWMLIGVPVVVVLVPLAWGVIARLGLRAPDMGDLDAGANLRSGLPALPPMSRGERLVALILGLTALAWVFRPVLSTALPTIAVSDAGIAMTAAVALFAVPVRWSDGVFLLDWRDAREIRWDVLILFGGGLALAGAMHSTGLAAWIGNAVSNLRHLPWPLLVVLLMAIVVYLGELASNTAVAAVFLPVAGAVAVAMTAAPAALMLPLAMAASLGFMLPVATPPNAIAYGSGLVSPQQMLRVGAVLDVISIPIVAAVAMALGPWIFR